MCIFGKKLVFILKVSNKEFYYYEFPLKICYDRKVKLKHSKKVRNNKFIRIINDEMKSATGISLSKNVKIYSNDIILKPIIDSKCCNVKQDIEKEIQVVGFTNKNYNVRVSIKNNIDYAKVSICYITGDLVKNNNEYGVYLSTKEKVEDIKNIDKFIEQRKMEIRAKNL